MFGDLGALIVNMFRAKGERAWTGAQILGLESREALLSPEDFGSLDGFKAAMNRKARTRKRRARG